MLVANGRFGEPRLPWIAVGWIAPLNGLNGGVLPFFGFFPSPAVTAAPDSGEGSKLEPVAGFVVVPSAPGISILLRGSFVAGS